MKPVVVHVVGARPNFVKIAPIMRALDDWEVEQSLVHTGQHYDARMSDDVCRDVGLRPADHFLGIGSGTHAEQIGRTLMAFDLLISEMRPDIVVVAGDVNATLACALAASRRGVAVAHVEAGLRSFDWEMPEESNRTLTDRLSDLLFTHSPEAEANLVAEGIDRSRIRFVGNTMIDSLRMVQASARGTEEWRRHGLEEGAYALVTLHRPSNVDDSDQLAAIVHALCELSRRHPVVFPVHPRTLARLEAHDLIGMLRAADVHLLEPQSYRAFLALELAAGAIVTDSGGVQEEASALGVPCYTLRANTERPVTISLGTNVLLGEDPRTLKRVMLNGRRTCSIPLWDGYAGERVAAEIGIALGATRRLRAA